MVLDRLSEDYLHMKRLCQRVDAKEDENNTPLILLWRIFPLLLEGNQINPLLRGVSADEIGRQGV